MKVKLNSYDRFTQNLMLTVGLIDVAKWNTQESVELNQIKVV